MNTGLWPFNFSGLLSEDTVSLHPKPTVCKSEDPGVFDKFLAFSLIRQYHSFISFVGGNHDSGSIRKNQLVA